jgi:hypothetical protein
LEGLHIEQMHASCIRLRVLLTERSSEFSSAAPDSASGSAKVAICNGIKSCKKAVWRTSANDIGRFVFKLAVNMGGNGESARMTYAEKNAGVLDCRYLRVLFGIICPSLSGIKASRNQARGIGLTTGSIVLSLALGQPPTPLRGARSCLQEPSESARANGLQ